MFIQYCILGLLMKYINSITWKFAGQYVPPERNTIILIIARLKLYNTL